MIQPTFQAPARIFERVHSLQRMQHWLVHLKDIKHEQFRMNWDFKITFNVLIMCPTGDGCPCTSLPDSIRHALSSKTAGKDEQRQELGRWCCHGMLTVGRHGADWPEPGVTLTSEHERSLEHGMRYSVVSEWQDSEESSIGLVSCPTYIFTWQY